MRTIRTIICDGDSGSSWSHSNTTDTSRQAETEGLVILKNIVVRRSDCYAFPGSA